MGISVDDSERDHKIIIQNFMKELCRRDDEENRHKSGDLHRPRR
jgi:hypothetical protein